MSKIDECADMLKKCLGAYSRLMMAVFQSEVDNQPEIARALQFGEGTGAECMKWLKDNGYSWQKPEVRDEQK